MQRSGNDGIVAEHFTAYITVASQLGNRIVTALYHDGTNTGVKALTITHRPPTVWFLLHDMFNCLFCETRAEI